MTREEVVKWLESLKREIGKAENRTLWHYAESIDMAIEALSEPKTGEWVRHELWDMPWYTCSECDFHGRNDYKFCPNCGARMLEKDGEA